MHMTVMYLKRTVQIWVFDVQVQGEIFDVHSTQLGI